MKIRILGIVILLAWGLIKLPFETSLQSTMEGARLSGYRSNADVRQRLGQASASALLGGLRGAVADLTFIRAHVAWQNTEYGRMKYLYDTCHALQPQRVVFYEMSAWMMAWNGGAYMEQHIKDPVERRREILKYWRLGESYALQGVENVPNSWVLWLQLGRIYEEKFRDYAKASWAYSKAAECPNHLEYVENSAAFMIAKIPGREEEAYNRLLTLYKKGESHWVPTLLIELQRMEKFLNIPADQRLDIREEDLKGVPRKKQAEKKG